jgi:hypothetical protein
MREETLRNVALPTEQPTPPRTAGVSHCAAQTVTLMLAQRLFTLMDNLAGVRVPRHFRVSIVAPVFDLKRVL